MRPLASLARDYARTEVAVILFFHYKQNGGRTMLERGKCIFVGVDVHKATHTAVIVDPWGEMIGKAITFNN